MKILLINAPNTDFSFYTSRGLNLEVTNINIPNLKFPLKTLGQAKGGDGLMYNLCTPDPTAYLEANYKTFQYSVIQVGWNMADYGIQTANTGGCTFSNPLSCGTKFSSVRQDGNKMYSPHEFMHCLVDILWRMGYHGNDQMDSEIIKGISYPYFINDPASTNPLSNFNVTWSSIQKFLPLLNTIVYMPTLTRNSDNGVETLGTLQLNNFTCKTLERPNKNNQPNISCIPK